MFLLREMLVKIDFELIHSQGLEGEIETVRSNEEKDDEPEDIHDVRGINGQFEKGK